MSEYFYEPRRGHGLPHDPFKAIVAPRPIGWISTIDRQGRVNLAPYSFFNAFASFPPIIGFSSEGRKDSLENAEATGEFAANLVGADLAQAMNVTATPAPHGTDEMKLAGLEAAPCLRIAAPRVAAAIAALECKLTQVIRLTDAQGLDCDNWLVLGEVVGVHIKTAYLKDGRFDTAAARPIARCGYRGDYAEVSSVFEILRPV